MASEGPGPLEMSHLKRSPQHLWTDISPRGQILPQKHSQLLWVEISFILWGEMQPKMFSAFFFLIKPDSLVLKEKLLLDLNFENVHNLDYDLIRK